MSEGFLRDYKVTPFKNPTARKVIRVDPKALQRIESILQSEYGSKWGCWQAFAHKALMNQLKIEEGTHEIHEIRPRENASLL